MSRPSIHFVQGDAPTLGDVPLRCAPSDFLKRENILAASDEDGVTKSENHAIDT